MIMADNQSLAGLAEDSKGKPMAVVESNNSLQDSSDYEAGNTMDIDPVQPPPPSKPSKSSCNTSLKDKASLESVAPPTETKNTKNPELQPQPKLMMRRLVFDVSVQMFDSHKN